jgi:hypothetical protein
MAKADTGRTSKTDKAGDKEPLQTYSAVVKRKEAPKKPARYRTFVLLLILVVCASAAAGALVYKRQYSGRAIERGEATDKEQVSVFYPDEEGRLRRKVVDVQRQVSDKARGETVLRELKEARSVPDRLKLYELALGKDGVLYLNLSGEFIDKSSPEREITMTYSIVNSFIESFRGAKSVQILVEGQPVYTRSGVLYVLEPLNFNRELLEE